MNKKIRSAYGIGLAAWALSFVLALKLGAVPDAGMDVIVQLRLPRAILASAVVLSLVWLGYGLWTENRILAWERDHPAGPKAVREWSQTQGTTIVGEGLNVCFIIVVAHAFDRLLARRRRERVLTGRLIPALLLDAFVLAVWRESL